MAIVRNGTVNKIKYHDYPLTHVQKINGHCLMCSYSASSDIELEVVEATSVADIPVQTLQAKLCRFEENQQIAVASFKLLRGNALRFLPGQSAKLALPDGQSLIMPIASCPCNANVVEFHLKTESLSTPVSQSTPSSIEGIVSELRSRKKSARFSISGPVGKFTLSDQIDKPKLFISQGDDFAQLQGMIEQVLSLDSEIPCLLIWQRTKNTVEPVSLMARCIR